MRGRGLIAVLVGLLAIALTVAGCGGDDGSSQASATGEISKPQFIKRAEAICKKNIESTRAGYKDFTKGKNPETTFDDPASGVEFAETVIIPVRKELVQELQALGAPSGDEDKVEEIIAAYEEGIEVGEGDPEKVMSSQGVFRYAADVASDYGLGSCPF